MHGPHILARFLSEPNPEPDKYGQHWQYNSRSDRHGKVGCWGIAFDLLAQSSLMQRHALDGKIVLGVNHKMRDYETGREKVLDLVVARPSDGVSAMGLSLRSLVPHLGISLTAAEEQLLFQLPNVPVAPVGAVLIALEAKAAMTAHVKSLPRLYDELNSSHLAVHGASSQALAIGYVQVNNSSRFLSSVINSKLLCQGLPHEFTDHRQPDDTLRVLDKVAQIPRRSGKAGHGFDAVGVTVLDFVNDGSPVNLVAKKPAPQPGDNFHYNGMIVRMANEYDATFAHI